MIVSVGIGVDSRVGTRELAKGDALDVNGVHARGTRVRALEINSFDPLQHPRPRLRTQDEAQL